MRKFITYFVYYLSRPFHWVIFWPLFKLFDYIYDYMYDNDGPWGKKGSI